MNHLTQAEDFRRRLTRLSRPQLEEAMRYLNIVDPGVVDRALAFAATPFTAAPSKNPLSVKCPDCGAPAGERCYTEFGCMTRYSVAQAAS